MDASVFCSISASPALPPSIAPPAPRIVTPHHRPRPIRLPRSFNNYVMQSLFRNLGYEPALSSRWLWLWAGLLMLLLSAAFLSARPDAYYRHRNRIMFGHRLFRIAGMYWFAYMLRGVPWKPMGARDGRLLGGGAVAEQWLLLKTLLLRSALATEWIHQFTFPMCVTCPAWRALSRPSLLVPVRSPGCALQ